VYLCYVDESGSADLLCQTSTASTPALVIAGLIVPNDRLMDLVWQYLQLKKQYNPSLATAPRLSQVIAAEVKGADLRSDVRSGKHRRERRALWFIGKIFDLLQTHHCRVVARVSSRPRTPSSTTGPSTEAPSRGSVPPSTSTSSMRTRMVSSSSIAARRSRTLRTRTSSQRRSFDPAGTSSPA